MPKLELTCRYRKKLSDEEKAELETNRIIKGYDEVEEPKAYVYGKLVLDVVDIKAFNDVDADHVCLRTYQNEDLIVKMDYNSFKKIYVTLTGTIIRTQDDFLTID